MDNYKVKITEQAEVQLKEVHITAVIYGKRAQLKQLEKMKL